MRPQPSRHDWNAVCEVVQVFRQADTCSERGQQLLGRVQGWMARQRLHCFQVLKQLAWSLYKGLQN